MAGTEVPIQSVNVDRDYFAVLRLPIVGGRAFEATDDERAPRVAVINETLARRQWPHGNAIGSTFVARGGAVRIIGIARDAKYANLTEATPSFVYIPMAQSWSGGQTLLVRTTADPVALGPRLRDAVRDIDPALPPPTVTTLDAITFAVMSAVFIGVALVATYVPARRAAAADPMVVLRAE